ncbi:uncharacterized protein L969DRAFT_50924 [Mixia osmundae IAM 14324]|uniref:Long-chain-alcohol oxidase n=1 Tax=Mixia osmundae (strain CBS 9802 / IAM 14324 / JCM 22182 / KY 12970) TaxID=764103 RepID=G7E7S3_MIXOS|nr:uncharacterized protein L969DRAFT_50924 [Mixia osmundae IAM 14324]KEI38483.1 hypothetical protein L969DRAFT_50924 [Mixia osmundae IAM 14324]GAA98883.1 hypothetical protein E5Q_05571 [Mixia osmundae IAM 14324]
MTSYLPETTDPTKVETNRLTPLEVAQQVKPLNDTQLKVLACIADTVFAAHNDEEAAWITAAMPADANDFQRKNITKFAKAKYSDSPTALDDLVRQMVASVSGPNIKDLGLMLSALSTRVGTFAMSGKTSAFCDLSQADRETVIRGWGNSPIFLLRKAYAAFTALTLFVVYNAFDTASVGIGYPFNGDPMRQSTDERIQKSYPFKFEQISKDYQTFDTEILIIGSGAGGGVVSATLSKAGLQVMVVEKGVFVPTESMNGRALDGYRNLYEAEGIMVTDDGSMNILAGSTFGGGTTVNWSASLKPQHYVREAWARKYGLTYFVSNEFQQSLDFVCERMGVDTKQIKHNAANQKLIDGAKKVGYHVDEIPQNTGGKEHSCGFCGFGCPYGEKQGGTATWLRDAAENGAKFMQGASVERILFCPPGALMLPDAQNYKAFFYNKTNTRAVGALLKFKDGRHAIVRAHKSVVVSGGSLNSPVILQKSGLTNRNIGRGLHLHPCGFVTGYYDEKIEPYNGAIMTTVSNVVENVDGEHFGAKIEIIASSAGTYGAAVVGWNGSKEHKRNALEYPNSVCMIILSRDRDGGRVYTDAEGKCRVDYTISPHDAKSMHAGIKAAVQMQLAAGARRISTSQRLVPDFIVKNTPASLNDPDFVEWFAQVEKAGVKPSWSSIGSAHQMGSNPMGTKPTNGAVDPRGRPWSTQGLYVADASVFREASGVNPMVTTMGVSHSIAKFIIADLAQSGTQPAFQFNEAPQPHL